MGASFVFPFRRPIVGPWETSEYSEEPLSAILVLGLSFVLGCALLGVSMLRSRFYSRAAAVLFLVGALILLTPLALNEIVFAVGFAWLGYELFAGKGEEVT
jgi:predicted MFS family arabinose efflux permease